MASFASRIARPSHIINEMNEEESNDDILYENGLEGRYLFTIALELNVSLGSV